MPESPKKNFALIGAAGYIAPRHLKAIKETGHRLVAALDPHDSVGILDSYFPEAAFFTEFERFDRHVEKLRREDKGKQVHYVSICSPNYLHDAHIRFALRIGAHAICEKPLVLNPWNIEALKQLEKEYGKKVYTILQLRVHPALQELKRKISRERKKGKHEVLLTYITSRGNWYHHSWKGRFEHSGGVTTNIGIHFFDLLLWFFGDVKKNQVFFRNEEKSHGFLQLKNASVRWFLSIDQNDLPKNVKKKHQRTYRSLTIDGKEVEFSDGFTDLHTEVYRQTLRGNGFGLNDAQPSISLAHAIREAKIVKQSRDVHPLARKTH